MIKGPLPEGPVLVLTPEMMAVDDVGEKGDSTLPLQRVWSIPDCRARAMCQPRWSQCCTKPNAAHLRHAADDTPAQAEQTMETGVVV